VENTTMSDPTSNPLSPQVRQQYRLVRGLQAAVYAQADPSANADLLAQLIQAESELHHLEQKATTPPAADQTAWASPSRFLGPETTGLRVQPTLNMQPLPTGIYHLLEPKTDPLLTVAIGNESTNTKRVCVKAFIEGLSAQAVRTVEMRPGDSLPEPLRFLPTLFPERAQAITEVQRATLHLLVENLDGKPESHDTFPLVCLARTSSFNAVRDPRTGRIKDFSHYYGAWVTPYAEAVQQCIRRGAELWAERQIWGYQVSADSVRQQVAALYQSVRETGIVYINSVIDYGAAPGMYTQRTRLPRESLTNKSANCIDGTVLMASLLEGASLNPAIVLVPGHAFLAWQKWPGVDEWGYLETTLIGTADFEAACQAGERQYALHQQHNPAQLKRLPLDELRGRGIWPME
jgi:hypothetical protein